MKMSPIRTAEFSKALKPTLRGFVEVDSKLQTKQGTHSPLASQLNPSQPSSWHQENVYVKTGKYSKPEMA